MRTTWVNPMLVVGACLAAAGCSSIPTELTSTETPTEIPIWDGDDPELCLAFSGGGIRSGAVSLGVLQGLHEHGLLTRAEMMSSVSGGGYPIYGIIAAKEKNPEATLDSLLSDGGEHIRQVESTIFIDNFDATWDAALASLWSFLITAGKVLGPTPNLVEPTGGNYGYSLNIHDTFAGGLVPSKMRLSESGEFVTALGLPYWIVQVSASSGLTPPREHHVYGFGDAFELSPSWIGSENFKFMRAYVARLTLAESISASAAAIDTPRTSGTRYVVPNWAKLLGFGLGVGIWSQQGNAIFLSDGGFVENQAVIPLLRRNCRHIIAVDAAHDPSAALGGWKSVAKYMQKSGWSVTTPRYLVDDLSTSSSVAPNAWELPSHVIEMEGRAPDGRVTKISILKLGVAPANEAEYPSSVRSFLEAEREKWAGKSPCNYSSLGDERPFFSSRCLFPQQTTMVQNFSSTEFRAYRCLGHYMVEYFLRRTAALGRSKDAESSLVAADCVGVFVQSSQPSVHMP